MIAGNRVKLGDATYICAPLNFGTLKKFSSFIDQLNEGNRFSMADIGIVQELVLASLRRNHPSVTMQLLDDFMDMGNAGELLTAVLTASGGTHVTLEDDAPGGEA